MNTIRQLLMYPLALPHLLLYLIAPIETKRLIDEDISVMNKRCKKNKRIAFYLITRKPYRNLFYYRLPQSRFFKILLPQYELFTIVAGCDFEGGAFVLNHPYATIINAKHIGKNFVCCHLTTIGNRNHQENDKRPEIGDNVTLGANVSIIGDVKIGNNVVIGAGSVVVKDIPSNSVAVGNPACVVKKLNTNYNKISNENSKY